ncbi:DUF7260 family protein [Halobellus rarus]|uniref:DUF7260 domain-containing protein n=1 Tax=Halobellus rarus TaxID=1126237 RepID=A0ABD6CTY3_9EURY|nr:hypothetical protein [Halobellus rarus]
MPDVGDAVSELTAARRTARDERRRTERQQRGFERFRRTVAETETADLGDTGATTGPSSVGWTASAPTTTGGCRRVRAAFEESVLPHVDDASGGVHAAIAAELSGEVAVALATEGGGNRFTEPLRRAVLDSVDQRLAEGRVMLRVLARELESLDDAIGVLKRVEASLPSVDKSDRLLCEDAELWARRRQTTALEADLDDAIRARQSTLDAVTSSDVKAGIGHDAVVEYLFGDRDTTYPALDGLARAVRECRRRRDLLDAALATE